MATSKHPNTINKFSRWLFIFEAILLVGVLGEVIEGLLINAEINIYIHILLLMLTIGILFSFTFIFLERFTKRILTTIVHLSSKRTVRIILHLIILGIIYYLYAKIFFALNVNTAIPFNPL